MDAREILEKLRQSQELTEAEIYWFAHGLGEGHISDAQAGAFAMGVCANGLSARERIQLTAAMTESGARLQWDLPGPVVDKHSTGGVGDPVTLILAPALAACGAYVPTITGRGLGHTGGTLDKMEAIPGLRTDLGLTQLQEQVEDIGFAMAAATADIAPADQRLYAVRDNTSTVESIPLICASILSKKLAEGIEALVLDVKMGSGAFMTSRDRARDLGDTLVATAQGAGCMTSALLTDMSQPLAPAAGNALEVLEVMKVLTGAGSVRLREVTEVLAGEALALGGMAADAEDGAGRIARAIDSGAAAERFGQMVTLQGGPSDFLERWRDRLPAAPVLMELQAEVPGVVERIDTRALGRIVGRLGGARMQIGDRINPAVGLSHIARVGQSLTEGQTIARIHAAEENAAHAAAEAVFEAYTFANGPVTPPPLIAERVG